MSLAPNARPLAQSRGRDGVAMLACDLAGTAGEDGIPGPTFANQEHHALPSVGNDIAIHSYCEDRSAMSPVSALWRTWLDPARGEFVDISLTSCTACHMTRRDTRMACPHPWIQIPLCQDPHCNVRAIGDT